MKQAIYIVDAFASGPFTGNPAAVCPLDTAPTDEWMQRVTAEMNLSETAFFWPEGDAFRLRWFTPTVEVALCGHATLASAHVLWETKQIGAEVMARFETLGGLLTAKKVGDKIELDFPGKESQPVAAPIGLIESLGVTEVFVGRNQFDYMIEVPSAAQVRAMTPDFARIKTFPVRGVIVTAKSDEPEFDFVSRFFAPAAGVDEDPVTGSAHCALACYWGPKLGKDNLTGYQASRRGGIVNMQLAGDRVLLRGHAITILRGELLV